MGQLANCSISSCVHNSIKCAKGQMSVFVYLRTGCLHGWPAASYGTKWAVDPCDNNRGWHFCSSSCSPASLGLQSDPWRPSFVDWHLLNTERDQQSLGNTTRLPGWLMRSLHLYSTEMNGSAAGWKLHPSAPICFTGPCIIRCLYTHY